MPCSQLAVDRAACAGLGAAALLLVAVGPAAAQSGDPGPATLDGWIVRLGFTSTVEPSYIGARRFRPTLMPSISARRAGEPEEFSAPEDGLDYTLLGTKTFQIGPVANLRGGRTVAADPRLRGLKKYPDTVDVGIFANVWPVEDLLRIRLEIRQGLRDDDGTVADLNADVVRRFGAFTLSGGPRLSFGDGPANRLELGVSGVEAMRNRLVAPYRPGAGLRSVGYGVALSYD